MSEAESQSQASAPTTSTATTSELPHIANREQVQSQLDQLKAAATKEYSLKNYAAASEFYSQAAELQDQLNGEMSLDNADLLYQYGRCLYHLGVSKSDVLGNKVAGGQEPQKKKKKRKTKPAESDALKDGEQKMAEDVVGAVVDEKETKKDDSSASKPFFQITGDENWTDSEDEGDDAEAEGEEEDEEDDDFAIAYEILDIARVLLTRKLESLPQSFTGKGKGKEAPLVENPEARQIMDRLADTHDLQAELSLENENFPEAVSEGRAALDLKTQLYPPESSLLAEAHFKLALAMEFASVTTNEEAVEGEAETKKEQTVDEELRKEAAEHMESAIESCRLRVKKEEEALPTYTDDKLQAKKREIKDVKEMISDMEQRLIDLRAPASSLASGAPAGAPDTADPLRGVLGAILGEAPAEQKKRIAEATKNANDLSGLIKKKKAKTEAAPSSTGAEKRKLEDGGDEATEKKVKIDEV